MPTPKRKKPNPNLITDMKACLSSLFTQLNTLQELLIEADEEMQDDDVNLFDQFAKPIEEMGASEKIKVAQLLIKLQDHFRKDDDVPAAS